MGTRRVMGGSIKPVRIITAADLVENGGTYQLVGTAAIPVHGLETADRPVIGGPAQAVYVVSEAEITAGTFQVLGGSATVVGDVVALGDATRQIRYGAIPVYAVNDWPADPTTPPFDTVTFVVGTEAANAITVSVQAVDTSGDPVTEAYGFVGWLSNTPGGGLASAAPNGGAAAGSAGLILFEGVTDLLFRFLTNAAGAFDLVITDSGTPTFYFNVRLPAGPIVTSPAITFA